MNDIIVGERQSPKVTTFASEKLIDFGSPSHVNIFHRRPRVCCGFDQDSCGYHEQDDTFQVPGWLRGQVWRVLLEERN